MLKTTFWSLAAILLVCIPGATQQHQEEVNRHGDMAMGFSHLKTTHHFALSTSGGSIEVKVNDANDTVSRDHIRMHLQHEATFQIDDHQTGDSKAVQK